MEVIRRSGQWGVGRPFFDISSFKANSIQGRPILSDICYFDSFLQNRRNYLRGDFFFAVRLFIWDISSFSENLHMNRKFPMGDCVSSSAVGVLKFLNNSLHLKHRNVLL